MIHLRHVVRDTIVSAVIVLAVVVFLALSGERFAETFRILAQVPPELLILGLVLVAGTYVAAAVSYVALGADRNIRLRTTIGIQTASGITNRLLPAGLGGAGLYVMYLKKSGFKYSQATAIVATNNIIGALGNFGLLVIALAFAPRPEQLLPSVSISSGVLIGVGCGTLAVLAILIVGRKRWLRRITAFVRDALRSLRTTLKPGRRTALSLIGNLGVTSINCLILCLAVVAAGDSMFWPLSVAVLSAGALLGAAVPTPGGLGGVEAGIVGGLIVAGVPAAPALAATLIYRGLTYWLPIIPGIAVLPWVRAHYLRA